MIYMLDVAMEFARLAADLDAHIAWLHSLIPNTDHREEFGRPAPCAYQIPDSPTSTPASDSDHENTSDAAEIRGQTIPEWARAPNLPVLMQKQEVIDPDGIFPDFDGTCDLSAIFETQNGRFDVRGDSGSWEAEAVTATETALSKAEIGLSNPDHSRGPT
jgi:hypothetical protein